MRFYPGILLNRQLKRENNIIVKRVDHLLYRIEFYIKDDLFFRLSIYALEK